MLLKEHEWDYISKSSNGESFAHVFTNVEYTVTPFSVIHKTRDRRKTWLISPTEKERKETMIGSVKRRVYRCQWER